MPPGLNFTWSMAKYIEATDTEDQALRNQTMDQILVYNKEDLAATWAVFQWLRSLAGLSSFGQTASGNVLTAGIFR